MSVATPADLAARVLQHYSSTIPINIHEIVRAEGIILRIINTKPDFNGVYIRLLDQPTIYVNGGHPQNRQTFTLAHELYHHLAAEQGAWNGRSRFHASSGDQNCREIAEERYANRFAGALLMPCEFVHGMAGMGLAPGQMAKRCQVSVDAMEIRLKELRLHHALGR